MNITNVDSITTRTYGFRVLDWEKKNLSFQSVAGSYIIGKIQFQKTVTPEEIAKKEKDEITIIEGELKGTDEKIAEILNQTITPFRKVTIKNENYLLKSTMVKYIESTEPFLFLFGEKEISPEALFGHIKNQANQS